jgi:hypothetical protein
MKWTASEAVLVEWKVFVTRSPLRARLMKGRNVTARLGICCRLRLGLAELPVSAHVVGCREQSLRLYDLIPTATSRSHRPAIVLSF